MKLSIIIPIYNVSKWLGRCLASVRNQGLNLEDYEIVAVNDGSTDDSMAVLESFRKKESENGIEGNWTIVSQKNKGLSAARNAGLKVAKGTYIWWVDSDDYLEPCCATKLLERADKDRLDVLCFGLQLVNEDMDEDASKSVIEPYEIPDGTNGAVVKGDKFTYKGNTYQFTKVSLTKDGSDNEVNIVKWTGTGDITFLDDNNIYGSNGEYIPGKEDYKCHVVGIGNSVFSTPNSVTSISIPSWIKTVRYDAFASTPLTTLNIPSTVKFSLSNLPLPLELW